MPTKRSPQAALPTSPRNPFVIGRHAEGDGFCDRKTEVQRIATAFRDASARLLVYGDRRLGKSSTIHEAARVVRASGHPVVVVDLAVASSAPMAAQRILQAVHRELGTRWRDDATTRRRDCVAAPLAPGGVLAQGDGRCSRAAQRDFPDLAGRHRE